MSITAVPLIRQESKIPKSFKGSLAVFSCYLADSSDFISVKSSQTYLWRLLGFSPVNG